MHVERPCIAGYSGFSPMQLQVADLLFIQRPIPEARAIYLMANFKIIIGL